MNAELKNPTRVMVYDRLLNLNTTDILGKMILCWGGRSEGAALRMVQYLASSLIVTTNLSLDIAKCSLRGKTAPGREPRMNELCIVENDIKNVMSWLKVAFFQTRPCTDFNKKDSSILLSLFPSTVSISQSNTRLV